MKNDNNGEVRALCEQGDMGLWDNPLSEADQKKYKEAQEKEEY